MDIVPLANRHRVALERYLQDFAQRGESELANFCRRPEVSHEAFVLRLAAHEAGDVPEGRVPSCMRFLEANGHLLGRYTLRFHLTPELEKKGGHIGYSVRPGARRQGHATRLLMHGMQTARERGIRRLLVTCDADNLGSQGVIRVCGGMIWDEYWHEPSERVVQRYWIGL